ncbi:MAG: hypothetical protein JOZ92_02975 [Candidatus Dormibacteraeota bacterium]|nr:hypothetical protein [Candidatus Dormibacteraeota bacterium]
MLDYLEVPGLPPTVVAHIRPRSRRNREHPLARRYMDAIERRATCVVSLPDESERVRYAVLEGIAVKDVSPRLRAAYLSLTSAVLQARQAVPA